MFSRVINIQQSLFGLALVLLGLNGFFKFLPLPERVGFAEEFMDTLQRSQYLMPTISLIQIGTGLSLLSRFWTNWGLLALLPISFNIFFFHLFHDQAALIPATIFFGLNLLHLGLRTHFSNEFVQVRSLI